MKREERRKRILRNDTTQRNPRLEIEKRKDVVQRLSANVVEVHVNLVLIRSGLIIKERRKKEEKRRKDVRKRKRV